MSEEPNRKSYVRQFGERTRVVSRFRMLPDIAGCTTYGMKGQISEFELGVLKARMLDAARSKAARGELRISVPIGYVWHPQAGLGLDPDIRVQEAIRQVFARFRELGSARQVLLALAEQKHCFPRPSDGRTMVSFDWTPIRVNGGGKMYRCGGAKMYHRHGGSLSA